MAELVSKPGLGKEVPIFPRRFCQDGVKFDKLPSRTSPTYVLSRCIHFGLLSIMTADYHPKHQRYGCSVTDRQHILWSILRRFVHAFSFAFFWFYIQHLDSSFYYTCCRGSFHFTLLISIPYPNATRFPSAYIRHDCATIKSNASQAANRTAFSAISV